MTEKNISMGEFIKQLTLVLADKNLPMPFKHERPWHELFYRLKTAKGVPGKPAFLTNLRFDWVGPYPRSQELSDYIHGLHWSGCVSAGNPGYAEITLNPELKQLWTVKLEGKLSAFVEYSLKLAEEEFAEAA